jgi:hypothetical protein
MIVLFALSVGCHAQSTDIFLMPGSDFTRPGLHPRANLNIGIGHTLGPLKRSPVGDEVTLAYTYENAGSHGFWHTSQGSHTESIGLMKNLTLGPLGLYTWQQIGITSLTGTPKSVQNRLYSGSSLGVIWHFSHSSGVWFQETYNKVETVPWYTSSSIGYVISF